MSKVESSIASTHYNDPFVTKTISNHIITTFPKQIQKVIVLCIGTDRSTGDSLGPMTGTLLSQARPKHMLVYGTLSDPVHALNLETKIEEITHIHQDAFVIAVDASLGKSASIGHFQSGLGSISPGAALKKDLPAVGDAYITGVVNISGLMEYTVLQSTRLSLVYEMALKLSRVLFHIDLWLHKYQLNQFRNDKPTLKINSQYIL